MDNTFLFEFACSVSLPHGWLVCSVQYFKVTVLLLLKRITRPFCTCDTNKHHMTNVTCIHIIHIYDGVPGYLARKQAEICISSILQHAISFAVLMFNLQPLSPYSLIMMQEIEYIKHPYLSAPIPQLSLLTPSQLVGTSVVC